MCQQLMLRCFCVFRWESWLGDVAGCGAQWVWILQSDCGAADEEPPQPAASRPAVCCGLFHVILIVGVPT